MKIKILKPDDWHVHFREGEMLKLALPQTYNKFSRAVYYPINPSYPTFNC